MLTFSVADHSNLRRALFCSVALYILLTGLLIWSVPLGRTPDESAHWDYISYIADNHKLPIFKVTKAPDYGYEFHQPPLYYVLNAPIWKSLGGGKNAQYAARIMSLICGAASIFFLWDALKVLFPARLKLIALSTLFAGLLPLHQAVGASGGNDALTGLICAVLLWIIAKGSPCWKWQHSIWLGVIAGLGILTKSSVLVIIVAAFGGMIHLLLRAQQNAEDKSTFSTHLKSTFSHIIAAFAIMAIVGGWWLARNQILYDDPLAMGVFQRAFAQSSPSPFMFFAAGVSIPTYLRALLSITFTTFWGIFGGPNTALEILNPFGATGAKAVALSALPLVLVFLCVTALGIWGVWRKLRSGMDKSTFTRVTLTWWMIAFALAVLSWLQFNTHYFQAQARYFHPALLPIVAGICFGWINIWGAKDKKLPIVSAIVGLSLIITTLWNVIGWQTLV